MIKFFRKIRQNTLSKGNTKKYLKYAFGEIFLIVIGILIALSINNWNEENKNNELQRNNLKIVVSDINENLREMEQIRDNYQKDEALFLKIMKDSISKEAFLNTKRIPYLLVQTPNWSMAERGVNLIKGNNLSNDTLINRLVEVYTHYSKYLAINENDLQSDTHSNMFYYRDSFDWLSMLILGNAETEIINESLYNNSGFKNRIGYRYALIYLNYLPFIKTFESQLRIILEKIEERLKND